MSQRAQTVALYLAAALGLGLFLTTAASCNANSRQRQLSGSFAALNVLKRDFQDYDRTEGTRIAKEAPLDQVDAALAAHRKTRDLIMDKLIIAYGVIAGAALEKQGFDVEQAMDLVNKTIDLFEQWKKQKAGRK